MRFDTNISSFLLTPETARDIALELLAGVNARGKPDEWKEVEFRSHYGTSSAVIANQWYDLCTTEIDGAKLGAGEMSSAGFKRFMMAHFFMWQYPKNARTFGSRFGVCERLSRGEPVWHWVDKISALHEKLIVWPSHLDDKDTQTLVLSIDGIDCRTWEKKTERYNMDTQTCSHKFNHGALKYEVAMSLLESQCVWISGPHEGGKHDLTIFREGGLKAKIMKWKKAIVDRGYTSKEEDEKFTLAIPRNSDSTKLNEYKGRARLRHESFNGRLKHYSILAETYRHNQEHHGAVFRAVAVTVQYEINLGAPLFDVPMERD